MPYRKNQLTHGSKPTDEIDNLTGRTEGDTVWNSLRNKVERWNGNVSLAQDMIALKPTSNYTQGYYMAMSTTADKVILTDGARNYDPVGVLIDSTDADVWGRVAIGGIYSVRNDGSATAGKGEHGALDTSPDGTVFDSNGSSDTACILLEDDGSESITAFADAGGGRVTVTSASHSAYEGRYIEITGTTNYNGHFKCWNVTTNTFEIDNTWVSDDATGTINYDYHQALIIPSEKQ